MMVARNRKGMSQAILAFKIGVTQPRISMWETRVMDIPKIRRAQIAELLEIDPDTLTDDA